MRVWAAATVSTFGSMVSRTALPFTAILVLDATPLQIGLLAAAELAPAFAIGLAAGAWVDRQRRRPILIATDLGRAALLLTVPAAALGGVLTLGQLYAVAAVGGMLSVGFDVAHRAYLPSLVRREELVEANGKLTAGGAVAEAGAFAGGGWLVQWLSGPVAVLLDAGSFLWSAVLIWHVRVAEPPPVAGTDATALGLRREIGEGLRALVGDRALRGLALSNATLNLGYQIVGAVFLLYVNQGLGFEPGVLGTIFAVGGVGSLLGAALSGRVLGLGIGPVLIGALLVTAAGQGLVPLATSTGLVAIGLLVGQQIVADAAATVYEVGQGSLLQALAPERLMGRIAAGARVLEVGAMLAGSLLGGVLGETVGLRPTLFVGVAVTALSAAWLLRSPVAGLRRLPTSGEDGSDPEDAAAVRRRPSGDPLV